MVQAVIFDLDGTLADTIEDIASAINGSLARRGLPLHDIATLKLMVGKGFRSLVVAALPPGERDEKLIEEIRAEASDSYAAHALDTTHAYPGVPELLAALAARKIPRAVLSNKPHDLVLQVVGGLFPGAGFSIVRGELPGFPRKPDPASALDIAASLGIEASRMCFVGDSDVDMITGRSAGMTTLGAGWGFRGARELEAAGADMVLAAPGELMVFFDRQGEAAEKSGSKPIS